MSNVKTNPGDGDTKKSPTRSLPSWMNTEQKSSGAHWKKVAGHSKSKDTGEDAKHKQVEGHETGVSPSSNSSKFSRLMEGVIFALSGFINPERGVLRSQALEMGAEYKPDWSSDCTLLVCAFPNTPKFRQVEADDGTIVAKEWISECHSQKKLVDIEPYIMHAGKPWRKAALSHGQETLTGNISQQKNVSHSKQSTAFSPSKNVDSNLDEDMLIPSTVKRWALEDLNRTIAWLESQEERPEVDEVKKIAAEGILTCLQDAIDALEKKQDVGQIFEQWKFIPQVVEELIKRKGSRNNATSISPKDLCKKAIDFKQIYESEYRCLEEDTLSSKHKKQRRNGARSADASYDSDETIEMTEEEIEQADNAVASSIPEF